MFKFLVPFLLATTLAYGQEAPNLDKLHNHFDNFAPDWDGSLQTVSPVIAKAAPLPVATPSMGNKCTTDDLKVVSDYFHSFGYTALLEANDKTRDNVRNEVMYNINDNSILALSLFFEKPLNSEDNKLTKICTEFQGVKTEGDGPTFKKFVMGQKMSEMNDALNEADQYKRDLAAGKKGEEHKEPYQGDPSKVDFYIPTH
jgi:hypothetical protein